jgi:hypothetical protein
MSRFKPTGTMKIGDDELQWHVRHWGGISHEFEAQRGLSVSVCVEAGRTRELILDFASSESAFHAPSQSQFEQRLREAIMSAIDDGWRPLSRGKAYTYQVPKAEDK